MSVEAMAIVLHHSRATGSDKVVLLGIANHDGDGGAWPKVETLMRYANLKHPRAVQKCLERLVELGELTIQRNGGGHWSRPSNMRPNLYKIEVRCPLACDRTTQHRLGQVPQTAEDLWITGVSARTGLR